jgi:hypothetical protein
MEHRASGTAVLALVYSGHMFRFFFEAIIAQLRNTRINTILTHTGTAANVRDHNLQKIAVV